MSKITEDLIPRESARRIINSPRNTQQMLMMLDAIPSVDSYSGIEAYKKAFEDIRSEIEREYYRFRNMSDKWSERACGIGTALEIIDRHNPDKVGKERK